MPDISINIEVWCSRGEGLCHLANAASNNRAGMYVDPCPECMRKEYDRGYDDGWDDGHEEGTSNAQQEDG